MHQVANDGFGRMVWFQCNNRRGVHPIPEPVRETMIQFVNTAHAHLLERSGIAKLFILSADRYHQQLFPEIERFGRRFETCTRNNAGALYQALGKSLVVDREKLDITRTCRKFLLSRKNLERKLTKLVQVLQQYCITE